MLTVNYEDFCDNMEAYMDKAADGEAVTVIREDNKDIVIISEEAYNNLMENAYLMENKANYDWLMESKEQLENIIG